MQDLPDSLFNHILRIYSGNCTFPGNLACASKRCKALCEQFKEKFLGDDFAIVMVKFHASFDNEPYSWTTNLKVNLTELEVPLYDLDIVVDGTDEFNFRLEPGWQLEKIRIAFKTKTNLLTLSIPYEPYTGTVEPFVGEGTLTLRNESLDLLEGQSGTIRSYGLQVEHEYCIDGEEEWAYPKVVFWEYDTDWDEDIGVGTSIGTGIPLQIFLEKWGTPNTRID